MDAMDRFVSRENIERYRRLSQKTAGTDERLRILKLLAEEEARFKLELSGKGDAPEGRSSVTVATEHRVEHDGEKRKGAG
jgi:hypothetical protein